MIVNVARLAPVKGHAVLLDAMRIVISRIPEAVLVLVGEPWSGQPEELMQQAEELAQQLMSMPETARKSELINLKNTNPILHAQVKQIMTDMTQQASSAGVSQMRQEMQQSGGA